MAFLKRLVRALPLLLISPLLVLFSALALALTDLFGATKKPLAYARGSVTRQPATDLE